MATSADSPSAVADDAIPLRRRTPITRCLLITLLPAFLVVWGKVQLLERGGLDNVALRFHDSVEPDVNPFSLLEQLTFFRADLLAAVVIIPATTLLLGRLLGRWRTVVLAVLSIAMLWGLYVEFQTQKQIGRFLSAQLIGDALTFSRTETGIAAAYVDRYDLLKPIACSLLIVVAAWWASGTIRVRAWPAWLGRAKRFALGSMAAVALVVTAVAWVPWLQANTMQRGVLTLIADAFQEFGSPHLEAELATLPPDELIARFRQHTQTPPPLEDRQHFGVAADCDVILFVMETAPASVFDTLSDQDLPNLARLKQRAWVGRQHHTTFPYTSHAMWSMITSWYPSSTIGNYADIARDRVYPGLMQSLKQQGRATAIYLPDEFSYWNDDSMYALVGIDKRVFTYRLPAISNEGDRYTPALVDLLRREQAALDEMKSDIAGWVGSGRRYAAIFLPQLGHAPWRDVDGRAKTRLDRGRAVIKHQDQYLGQLMAHLESLGRLDKTIILITGDHGVRSRREWAEFRPGMIGDASFRVPMILYCPPALMQPELIPAVTSHLDVAPSILDQLGVNDPLRVAEQGAPMWDDRLAGRTVYFFAANYLGCDGFRTPDGQCFMWNRVEDLTYQSDALRFDGTDLQRDETERQRVMENLAVMDAIRKAWLRHARVRREGELPPPTSPAQPASPVVGAP